MRKVATFLFGLVCSSTLFAVAPYNVQLPDEFYVKERPYSVMSTFDIETKQYKLGYVQRKFLSLRFEYDFYDVYDELQAKAVKRLLSFGTVFDVTDAQEQPIGTIEQAFSFFFPTFRIVAPTQEIVAEASLNFWGTCYTVTSPLYAEPVAKLTRSFFRLKDDWTITILEPTAFEQNRIDPRLFMVLTAFQTDKEYWQKVRNSAKPRTKRDPKEVLEKKLTRHHKKYAGVKAKAKHYKETARKLEPIVNSVTDATFYETCDKLLELVDSNELSSEEKKALLEMLQNRISG